MADEQVLREAVVIAARQLQPLGLAVGTAGNISVRLGPDMLITPSGVGYDELTAGDIVRMGLDGGYDGGLRPSSEWRMHAAIYDAYPQAGAVVHTHSTHATALACLNRPIPAAHYMVAAAGGDDIRCASYATFGTEALSQAMLAALEGRKACLLANHGTIVFGSDLDAAMGLSQEVEEAARIYLLALSAGQPVILSAERMAEVHTKFAGYGTAGQGNGPSAVSGIHCRDRS